MQQSRRLARTNPRDPDVIVTDRLHYRLPGGEGLPVDPSLPKAEQIIIHNDLLATNTADGLVKVFCIGLAFVTVVGAIGIIGLLIILAFKIA